jgi:hypothetical protein
MIALIKRDEYNYAAAHTYLCEKLAVIYDYIEKGHFA